MMIQPPFLKSGDMIGVMAPSSRIARADIETAKLFLESRGYDVFIHPQTYLHADDDPATQYAGTVQEKISALHDLAANADIKAVFFASGGQRAMHLLDHLDYKLIAKSPKIYMGFSDNTSLVNAISAKSGLVTYHGPTFKRLLKNPQADFNLRLLSGLEQSVPLDGATTLKKGTAEGTLYGGNLATVRTLLDSDLPGIDGGILFLEEIGEELSTIDRDLCGLKRRGILNRIGGLIFGQFSDLKDTGTPFGARMDDIIAEHTAGLNIPIVANAPFGHGDDLYALPVGAKARLEGTSLHLI